MKMYIYSVRNNDPVNTKKHNKKPPSSAVYMYGFMKLIYSGGNGYLNIV